MRGGCFPVNNIEIQMNIKGDSVKGSSYHYLDVNSYVKKSLSGWYDRSSRKLYLKEVDITTYKIPATCKVCIKNYDLVYSTKDKQEILKGGWNGKIFGTGEDCSTGPITLFRIKESAFKEIPEVLVDTGELRLDFYDNAEIDGDSITVVVNNKVILSNQRLGIKPITAIVKIDPQNTFQEVEMRAENLGSIPPNTAVLIVTSGQYKYHLFLTSTETKNAKVRFVYDKKERGRSGVIGRL